MKVNFGGIIPLSTVDWPGRAAMVVFLRGCPLHCPHCHNSQLQTGERQVALHDISSRIVSEVKGFRGPSRAMVRADAAISALPGRPPLIAPVRSSPTRQIELDEASQRASDKPFVDALVLSGGEPLLQPEASSRLFRLARSLHLSTGLETSGCFPDRLGAILATGLVDRVFLDIKADLQEPDYEMAVGRENISVLVRQSLEVGLKSEVTLEVRSTVFPEMPSSSQLERIAGALFRLKSVYPNNRLERMTLQQGQPRNGEAPFDPVSVDMMQKMAEGCRAASHGQLEVRVHATPKITWEN
ncbi:MAG: radical SAM protein [Methanothrix sp.]|nr:radical SAM protein [Methanothrix sp.]